MALYLPHKSEIASVFNGGASHLQRKVKVHSYTHMHKQTKQNSQQNSTNNTAGGLSVETENKAAVQGQAHKQTLICVHLVNL